MPRRVTSARFVGREQESGELRAALDRAVEGEPTVALVGGEAGVGKSRLVAEFAAVASALGAGVASGGCVELGDLSLPFAPVVEVLRSLARTVAPAELAAFLGPARDEAERLVPDLAAILETVPPPARPAPLPEPAPSLDPDPAARSRRLELLLGVLHRLSLRRPFVVILEDLHWADPSTLDLLAYVTRNLTRERLVVVGTYRSDGLPAGHPLRHVLSELLRDRRVERIELGPLPDIELRQLVGEVLGDGPPDLVERVVARSDGNPFFAEELIAAEQRVRAAAVPDDLRELILDRVRRLPAAAQAVVRLAAIAGRSTDDDALAVVTGLDPAGLDAALRAATDERILVPSADGTGYTFRHALLGEAVDADILPGERRRLHAALAATLAARPLTAGPGRAAEAAERARHWEGAGRPAEALRASLEAAEAALSMAAFAEAAAQLERVLRLWEQVPEAVATAGVDRAEVAARAARACFLAGESDRAVGWARSALGDAAASDPSRRGALTARLASYLLAANEDVEALERFREAIELLTEPAARAERLRALCGLGAALMLAGRHRESMAACREALAVATPELRWLAAPARTYLGVDLVCLGEVEEGLAELRAARAAAATIREPVEALLEADHNLACMLDRADRLEEALQVALDGAGVAARSGLGSGSGTGLRAVAAQVLTRLGRWDEAASMLEDCLRLRPQGEHALLVHQGLAVLAVRRGEPDAATEHLAEVDRLATRSARVDLAPATVAARVDLALLARRWGDAAATAAATATALAAGEDGYWVVPLAALGVRAEAERSATIRASRSTPGLDASRQAAAALLELARAAIDRLAAPPLALRAWFLVAQGEWARWEERPAAVTWAAAADAFETLGQPFELAYARFREAEALLASKGGRAAAEAALLRAVGITDHLAAQPLGQAIDDLARRARLELAARPAPERARDPSLEAGRSLGLTPRETEILGLVRRGRTNRAIAEELFITEKTVGVHMTNILGKLGVASRLDAAAIAAHLAIGDEPRPAATETDGTPTGGDGAEQRAGVSRIRRAFLCTDIVRSTDLVRAIGDEAWLDLRRWHDGLLRALFDRHGGEEIDHAGDGFLVAFEHASAALDCAVAIQRALADHRRSEGFAPRVRVGIHAAVATRSGLGFTGRALHEVSRLAALAGPDEIIASEETGREARAPYPLSAPRRVTLRGLDEPTRVVTVAWAGSRVPTPPPPSTAATGPRG